MILDMRTSLTACAVVLGLVSAACGGSSTGDAGRVQVVASFYPLAEVAQRVGGDHVQVDNLSPVGAEPHDLELRASQVALVKDAKVVFVLGKGFQPAIEKAAASNHGTVRMLERLPIEQRGDVAPEGSASNRASIDPHVWLDPTLMARIVAEVRTALASADPRDASQFAANAERFDAELVALDGRYKSGLAHCTRTTIVTGHQAFGRLAARYGLTQKGIGGLTPDAEPSPDRVAELTDLVRSDGITTVFTETLVSPKIAQTLAREAGVRTEVLDPLEGLTKEEIAAHATFVSVMDANLLKLRSALGCQ